MKRDRYAPMDWIYSRPHGKVLADAARESHREIRTRDELVGAAVNQKLMPFMKSPTEPPVMAAIRYSVAQVGQVAAPQAELDLRWEGQVFSDVMAWARSGRQIFRFDEMMTESLRNIDFGEATVGDVAHPYDSYYLVYDGLEHRLPNGAMLDGIIVTSTKMPPKDVDRGALSMEVINRLLSEGVPTEDMLRRAHAEISTVPVLTISFQPRGYALWPEARVHGYSYELELTDPTLPLRDGLLSSAASFAEGNENPQYHPLPDLAEWVDLIMNSALYLTRYDDSKTMWQTEAPATLVDGARAGRKSPQRELARLGYAETRFVRFGGGGDDEPSGERPGVRPHWRRGHWRNQPHGPRNSLRKLVLVRPVRVGWNAGSADETGSVRVYDVAMKRDHPESTL